MATSSAVAESPVLSSGARGFFFFSVSQMLLAPHRAPEEHTNLTRATGVVLGRFQDLGLCGHLPNLVLLLRYCCPQAAKPWSHGRAGKAQK